MPEPRNLPPRSAIDELRDELSAADAAVPGSLCRSVLELDSRLAVLDERVSALEMLAHPPRDLDDIDGRVAALEDQAGPPRVGPSLEARVTELEARVSR